MKKAIALLLAGGLAVVFTACGGSTPAKKEPDRDERPRKKIISPDAVKNTEAPAAKKMDAAEKPAPAAEAPKQPDTSANPAPAAAADPMQQKLIGTVWNMPDGTEVTFKDAKTAIAKGGKAALLGPNGLTVAYTFAGGKLELNAMGTKMAGTWDGEKLTIDGNAGVKK